MFSAALQIRQSYKSFSSICNVTIHKPSVKPKSKYSATICHRHTVKTWEGHLSVSIWKETCVHVWIFPQFLLPNWRVCGTKPNIYQTKFLIYMSQLVCLIHTNTTLLKRRDFAGGYVRSGDDMIPIFSNNSLSLSCILIKAMLWNIIFFKIMVWYSVL